MVYFLLLRLFLIVARFDYESTEQESSNKMNSKLAWAFRKEQQLRVPQIQKVPAQTFHVRVLLQIFL